MARKLAKFDLTLSAGAEPSLPVAVDYATVAETAAPYADYVTAKGTAVWNAGDPLTKTILVHITGDTTSLDNRAFELVITNFRNALPGEVTSREIAISGPPVYAAVPFPGSRAAVLGDSIFYADDHWNPPNPVGVHTPPIPRNEYYSTGMTGFLAYTNALMGHAFELEPALQPNTNPGLNATAPKSGYNFAIYSSQTAQWLDPDFDPLQADPTSGADAGGVATGVAHNIGPMVNALAYIDKFDCVFILGGTNDLSAGLSAASVLANLQSYCYQLAAAGKWVFIYTLTPRSADLLQLSATGQGYSQAQVAAIMQALLDVNRGLRDWVTNAAPPNIYLVDPWDDLVGPTPSILSVPTDPAGLLSPSSGIVSGALIPSTPGNYRSDAPGLRFFYDGLHMAPPASYVLAKKTRDVAIAAGVPLGTPSSVGPITIGPNLMSNPTMVCSTNGARAPGAPLVLGRAIGLGAPVAVAGVTGTDAHTNLGAGYTYGPVPDHYFIYRSSNNDGESFSNFNAYTFSALNGQPNPAPAAFQQDSTWADGCLRTSIVTVDGVPGLRLDFNCPATGNSNEAFIVRYLLAEGQHNVWDNFGFETGATRVDPAPPYAPGVAISADCVLQLSGLTPNLCTTRLIANFLCVDESDDDTDSAVISGIALAESYFPFSHIADCHQHTEDKTLTLRTPAVITPTAAANETWRFLQLNWQFSFDCATQPATATIIIMAPRVAVLTIDGAVPAL